MTKTTNKPRESLHIKSMQGIGDNIYQRPFVKHFAKKKDLDVYIETPLPFVYDDLNVKFVKPPAVPWRTQNKYITSIEWDWTEDPVPKDAKVIDPFYNGQQLLASTIPHSLQKNFELHQDPSFKFKMDLPPVIKDLNISDILRGRGRKKIAVVRPVTIRREWRADGRSPLPHYINWCSMLLINSGYFVVSIADLKPKEEWLVGDAPPCHVRLHNGELSIPGVLRLIQMADIVVGGPGFIIPAAVAADTPLFVIFGGRGGYDSPAKDFDPRMDMRKIGWALPDQFCRCTLNNSTSHECNKHISNLDHYFMTFLKDLQLLGK